MALFWFHKRLENMVITAEIIYKESNKKENWDG